MSSKYILKLIAHVGAGAHNTGPVSSALVRVLCWIRFTSDLRAKPHKSGFVEEKRLPFSPSLVLR